MCLPVTFVKCRVTNAVWHNFVNRTRVICHECVKTPRCKNTLTFDTLYTKTPASRIKKQELEVLIKGVLGLAKPPTGTRNTALRGLPGHRLTKPGLLPPARKVGTPAKHKARTWRPPIGHLPKPRGRRGTRSHLIWRQLAIAPKIDIAIGCNNIRF